MARERLVAIGGPRHGEEFEVAVGAVRHITGDNSKGFGDEHIYERRTFRFIRRDPRNPKSDALMRYWTAEALVHESIADDLRSSYGWWRSLADARLFERYGADVTDSPQDRARFGPQGES